MSEAIVRRLTPGDWALYREIRLAALTEAPSAFGSTLAREAPFTPAQWQARLAHNTTLIAERDGVPVGLVSLIGDEHDPARADLTSMWVGPAARGSGAADLLVRAALRTEPGHPARVVHLLVTEGNHRAEALYRRHGFTRTGVVQPTRAGSDERDLEMRWTDPGADSARVDPAG